MINRKVTYRLYPNASQEKRLHEVLVIHQRIYNEALEVRIKAYRIVMKNSRCLLLINVKR